MPENPFADLIPQQPTNPFADLIPEKKPDAVASTGPTLDERASEVFGFDPAAKRGTLFPGFRLKAGADPKNYSFSDLEVVAPQIAVDFAKSFLLPGHVMKGGEYSQEDVTRMALDVQPFMRSPVPAGRPIRARKSATRRSAPNLDEVKREAAEAFETSRRAGAVIEPKKFATLADDIAKGIEAGRHPRLHTQIPAALDDLTTMRQAPQSLDDLHKFRQTLQDISASQIPGERRLAMQALNKLDDFIADIGPADILAGDSAGAAALQRGIKLWSRVSKTEEIQELVRRAGISAGQYSGSGFENALRVQFAQLARNQKRMRRFTPAERKAIEEAAKTGGLHAIARWFGKLAPRGVVSTTLSGGLGHMAGGPAGAAGMYGAGELGRAAATAMREGAAQRVADLTLYGGPLMRPNVPLSPLGAAALQYWGPLVGTQLEPPYPPGGNR